MKVRRRKNNGNYLRNVVFGVEDSLVSTVGLLSGVAAAGVSQQTIVLTGVVLLFVEAFSMGVGTYLSEQSEEEYLTHKEASTGDAMIDSVVMFISYFVSGFIPLSPYILTDPRTAFFLSVAGSLCALYLLGAVSASYVRINIFRHGFKMFALGGAAILVGILAGNLVLSLVN